jgi:hypothetical protein
VLGSMTEKDFQEAFQKWRIQWDRCLHVGGNYVLRGWLRPIGLMVSLMIFTASVRNILD